MDFPWAGLGVCFLGWLIYREAKKDGLATWKAWALAIGGSVLGAISIGLVLALIIRFS